MQWWDPSIPEALGPRISFSISGVSEDSSPAMSIRWALPRDVLGGLDDIAAAPGAVCQRRVLLGPGSSLVRWHPAFEDVSESILFLVIDAAASKELDSSLIVDPIFEPSQVLPGSNVRNGCLPEPFSELVFEPAMQRRG